MPPRGRPPKPTAPSMVATSGVKKRAPRTKSASATPEVPSTRSSLPMQARAEPTTNSPKACPTCGCTCNTNNTTTRQTWTQEQLETWRNQIRGHYHIYSREVEDQWPDDIDEMYLRINVGKIWGGLSAKFNCVRVEGTFSLSQQLSKLFPGEPARFQWTGEDPEDCGRTMHGGGDITITKDFKIKCDFFDLGDDAFECEGEKYEDD
ncbi:hypothetical protein H072_11101 [Dactylellina haptotyla CBS 200.50]|uniref:Uncharacterized protein n=1 Tax=Dactylellina haptotyla (strain CBS 200.50) TaxID=1284197 RepID=S7ZYL9_DACHA|nr:hypothetical protein H072_11101 [Dactylellina haptotyla CBS 200.50]